MSDAATPPADAQDVVRLAARAHERDRYLAALLSPRAARDDLVALAAFAGEVGRIPLYVREPMMGRIRLQWWRERIETATSGGHPVTEAIIPVVNRHNLPTASLIGLIDAHEDSLDDRPFDDDAALLGYVDRIDGAMFSLAALICKCPANTDFARNAGRAYGLARIGLEAPAALSHGRLLLPFGSSEAATELQHLRPALQNISANARHYLAECAATMRLLPRRCRSPYLPLALVEPYLQALEQKLMLADVVMEISPVTRVWRLLRGRWTGSL